MQKPVLVSVPVVVSTVPPKVIWRFELNLYSELTHAYQSLACKTAMNIDFSELFSLKHSYVKYKNTILSLIDCFFHT